MLVELHNSLIVNLFIVQETTKIIHFGWSFFTLIRIYNCLKIHKSPSKKSINHLIDVLNIKLYGVISLLEVFSGENKMEYISRVADNIIRKKLKGKGSVLVQGPKWRGKTNSCEQLAESILYMTDPSTRHDNLVLAEVNPSLLLEGEVPRLIDEWQEAPKLWDAVRFQVDHRNSEGQFLLTGSVVPPNTDDIGIQAQEGLLGLL